MKVMKKVRRNMNHVAYIVVFLVLFNALCGKSLLLSGAEIELRPVNWRHIEPKLPSPRAMWIWHHIHALDPEKREDLFRFCEIRGIGTLFLYTGPYFFIGSNRPYIRNFLREAHTRNIKVEALDGWPQAVFPEQQEKFLASLKAVLDYNSNVEKAERFTGFQSNVEPWTMEDYRASKKRRAEINTWYLELHRRVREIIEKRKVTDFSFGKALSAKYDREGDKARISFGGRFELISEHLIRYVDNFAIMAYRDLAKEIIGDAYHEVDLAGQFNKKAWVGVETMDIATAFNGPRAITFFEEGLIEMEKQLEEVIRHFQGEKGFAGIAIHYYELYRRLPDDEWDFAGPLPTLKAERLADVVIDAKPDEWKRKFPIVIDQLQNVVHGRGDWKGPEDLSLTAFIGYDETAIYLFVDIKDNKFSRIADGAGIWKNDYVAVWILPPGHEYSFQIGFSPISLKDGSVSAHIWYPMGLSTSERGSLIRQLSAQATVTEFGYSLEGRIPFAVLGTTISDMSEKVSFTLEAGDTDSPDKVHRTLISASPARERNRPKTFGFLMMERGLEGEKIQKR